LECSCPAALEAEPGDVQERTQEVAAAIPDFELFPPLAVDRRWDAGLTIWIPRGNGRASSWTRLVMEWPPRLEQLEGWQTAAAACLDLKPARWLDRWRRDARRAARYVAPDGTLLVAEREWGRGWFAWPVADSSPAPSVPAGLARPGAAVVPLGPRLYGVIDQTAS
jgi:hypothetical protein